MAIRIAILGEGDLSKPARATISSALEHSAAAYSLRVSSCWYSDRASRELNTGDFDGLFISPGAPGEGHEAIIEQIWRARQEKIPCLGTCGGFQRVVEEFAVEKLRLKGIAHQEITPEAVDPLFSALECSLVGKEAAVLIRPGTLAWQAYGAEESIERFFCSYGINPKFVDRLERCGDFVVSGIDANGDARIVEIRNHPFFVGTLFVPQVRSLREKPHRLVSAFVLASKRRAEKGVADKSDGRL